MLRPEQLWPRIRILDNGCWEWTGSRCGGGYGTAKAFGKNVLVHRASYEMCVGPIPTGQQLDHLCRNRRCVNPIHLEPVTSRENVLRGAGLCAINHKKTHCASGHDFSHENTLIRPNGSRWCRACARIRATKLREKIKITKPIKIP